MQGQEINLHDEIKKEAIKNDSFSDNRESDFAMMLKLEIKKAQLNLEIEEF